MKVAVVGNNGAAIRRALASKGLELVAPEAAELVIAYGGDGTLIGAEREYPDVPKLGIRDSGSTLKCPEHEDDRVIERLVAGELESSELVKLEARIGGHVLYGVNDIIMRNADVRSSVRFEVYVNDEMVGDENIGDGLVVATPFGSSAYFRSITSTTTRCGIGVAYNNCTEFLNHLVLHDDDRIGVRIVRGPAVITADNAPEVTKLAGGDRIEIVRSSRSARVLGIDGLRCGQCRYQHAPRRRY